jgi:hypothetical protein
MPTYISTNGVAGANLNVTMTDSTGLALGTEVVAQGGARFVYCHADGAITAGDLVAISDAYEVTRATIALAISGDQLGFAQVAFADNEYGWIAISGNPLTSANVSATSTLNVPIYIGTTSGHISTTGSSATIAGVALMTANASTAVASFQAIVTWPRLMTDGHQ